MAASGVDLAAMMRGSDDSAALAPVPSNAAAPQPSMAEKLVKGEKAKAKAKPLVLQGFVGVPDHWG